MQLGHFYTFAFQLTVSFVFSKEKFNMTGHSFVENVTFTKRSDNTALCKIARPPIEDQLNLRGNTYIKDANSPKPNLCQNVGLNGPCCFVDLAA